MAPWPTSRKRGLGEFSAGSAVIGHWEMVTDYKRGDLDLSRRQEHPLWKNDNWSQRCFVNSYNALSVILIYLVFCSM